jgi:hypothetical protein
VSSSPDHLARARAADSDRRRTRVPKVLDKLAADGEEITVSSVARAAGVHHSLIHRHGDLHAAVLARAGEPPPGATAGTQVSRQSLPADIANLTARNSRLSGTSPGSNDVCLKRLDRLLGKPPGSVPPPTSKHSPAASANWSSGSSTSAPNSPSATRTSLPHAPRTRDLMGS